MPKDKITLSGMEFFAYHGYFEEERKIGNKYSVDLVITTNFQLAAKEDNLNDTVDYTVLYQEVEKIMSVSSKLLEHVALQILESVFGKYSTILDAEVTVKKHNPPLGGICKYSAVTMKRKREDFI